MKIYCDDCKEEMILRDSVEIEDLEGTIFEDRMSSISPMELENLAVNYPNDIMDEESRVLLNHRCPRCNSKNIHLKHQEQ